MSLEYYHSRFLRAALPLMLAVVVIIPTRLQAQTSQSSKTLIAFQRSKQETTSRVESAAVHQDNSVTAAGFNATQAAAQMDSDKRTEEHPRDPRQLAPPTSAAGTSPPPAAMNPDRPALSFSLPQKKSLTTAGAGLAIVVGLFLLCMSLLGRSGPKPTTPLPKEVAAVLGRIPLAARNFAHLVRVGNKLILVAITPEGATPLAEVTDPAEVDRLLGLCMKNHKQSTTAEFHQVLQQLANEPARGFLGNEASAISSGARR